MPFGLKNAPAAFNRLLEEIQRRVETGNMLHCMEDILVGINSFDEMYAKLSRILQVLHSCGLTLNINIFELFTQTIHFLHHQLSPEGISPGNVKTNAVVHFRQPKNVTEVRKVLGLSGYCLSLVVLLFPNRCAKTPNSRGDISNSQH